MQSKIELLLNNAEPLIMHSGKALETAVTSQHNDMAFSHTLTLAGQAVTPFMVSSVLSLLANVFAPSSIAFHHLHHVFGDDVIEIRGALQESPEQNEHKESTIKSLLTAISDKFALDVGLQCERPALSKPGLLVMDMDSTIIAIECIDEIAKLANVGEQVAEVTAKAMRGEIAFNESLTHRVACLAGVPLEKLSTIRDSLPIMPGIQGLITTLQKHDWKLAIASGGFTYFADHLKVRLGLDYAVSNILSVDDGKLTGDVEGDIVNADVKASTVAMLAEKWNIPASQTVAMGDGANDLVMMAHSALGVACHGKPVVNEKADVAVRVGSLHRMLYFLGA